MKITLSKSQWTTIGKQTGWLNKISLDYTDDYTAQDAANDRFHDEMDPIVKDYENEHFEEYFGYVINKIYDFCTQHPPEQWSDLFPQQIDFTKKAPIKDLFFNCLKLWSKYSWIDYNEDFVVSGTGPDVNESEIEIYGGNLIKYILKDKSLVDQACDILLESKIMEIIQKKYSDPNNKEVMDVLNYYF